MERFPYWGNEKTCFFSNFYTNCIPVIRQVAAHCWAGILAAPRKALLADLLRLLRILATLDGVGDRETDSAGCRLSAFANLVNFGELILGCIEADSCE